MTLTQAILSTLVYHDLFDYPLTSVEIQKYLIGKSTEIQKVEAELKVLQKSKKILMIKNYYLLKGRNKIVKKRTQRQVYSIKKHKRALLYSKILKIIPTIKLLAITGSLAMKNSSAADDIDLMIITSKNTLWTTRFLSTLLLLPFKRSPKGSKKSNKACLNIFIDQKDLKIKERNLYTAHEIKQIYVLWDRKHMYQKFIKANNWIKEYLPNWKPDKVHSGLKIVNRKARQPKIYLPLTVNYSPVENLFKRFQLYYMKSKITTEKIGEHQLFFHPQDTQNLVLSRYQKAIYRLKI